MDHEQNDILISAYLDDELTAEEQARVEQLLATSADARQLVEELRALRAGLKELPQHKLGVDFAAEVLRRAEREMQASAEAGGEKDGSAVEKLGVPIDRPQPPESSESGDAERSTLPLPRFWKSPRGIGWSLAALAVAVMILVTNRRADQNNLGEARRGEAVVARAPEPAPSAAPAAFALHEMRSDDAAGVQSGKDQSSRELKPTDETSELRLNASKTATDASQNKSTIDQPTNAPAQNGQLMDRYANDRSLFSKEAEKLVDKEADSLKAMPPVDAVAGSQPDRAPAGAVTSPASSSPAAAPVGGARLGRAATAPGAAAAEQESLARQLPSDAEGLLVVEVQMSPEAAQRGDFQRLLARNEIYFDEAARGVTADFDGKLRANEAPAELKGTESTDDSFKMDVGKLAQQEAPPELAKKSLSAGDKATRELDASRQRGFALEANADSKSSAANVSEELRKIGSLRKSLLEQAATGKSDVIRVEASPQQIERVIASLRESPQSFPTVVTESAQILPPLQESLQTANPARAEPQSAANRPAAKLPQAFGSSNAGDATGQFKQRDEAQRDQLQTAPPLADAKKLDVVRGRARRLSPTELQDAAAGETVVDGKPLGAAGSLKSEVGAKEASRLDANGPPATAAEEKSMSAPVTRRAKQMAADGARGGGVGGNGGGFGGGVVRGNGSATSGGKVDAQPKAASEQRENAPLAVENRQRALFVLRIVEMPADAAAAKLQAGPTPVPPGKPTEKPTETSPAKSPADSK